MTKEIATAFGCLDSAAIADGAFAHAHVLRVLAMQSNRLYAEGAPVLQLVFDSWSGANETTDGTCEVVGWGPWWRKIYNGGPMYAPKKPHLATLEVKVIANIPLDEKAWFQFTTTRQPYRFSVPSTANNVVECTGTGAWATYSLATIPASEGQDYELIDIYMRSSVPLTVADDSTYGVNTSGSTLTRAGLIDVTDETSEWNMSTGSKLSDYQQHAIAVLDTAGHWVIGPRIITGEAGGGATVGKAEILYVWPPMSPTEAMMVAGLDYEIRVMPRVRVAAMCFWEVSGT